MRRRAPGRGGAGEKAGSADGRRPSWEGRGGDGEREQGKWVKELRRGV